MTEEIGRSADRVDPLESDYLRVERLDRRIELVDWSAVFFFFAYATMHALHLPYDSLAKWPFVAFACVAVGLRLWLDLRERFSVDQARRTILVADSFGLNVGSPRQHGYYTSVRPPSALRFAESLAENTFFFPKLIRAELPRTYVFCAISLVLLIASIRVATVEYIELFGLLVLFGESGVAKAVRMIWAAEKLDSVHAGVCSTLVSAKSTANAPLLGKIVMAFVEYEVVKSKLRARPSKHVFDRLNPELSRQWADKLRGLHSDSEL